MIKITLLGVILLCLGSNAYSQSCQPYGIHQEIERSLPEIEGYTTAEFSELLYRYKNIGPRSGPVSAYFSLEEQRALYSYFQWLKHDRTKITLNDISQREPMNEVAVFSTEWTYGKFSKFGRDSSHDIIAIAPIGSNSFENAGVLNVTGDTAYVLGSDGDFWSVDVATGIYTFLATITPVTGGTWVGLEWDNTTSKLYALAGNFTIDNYLYELDLGSLSANVLPNPTGMPGGGIAIAIDGSGGMWSYDVTDNMLYEIDKLTGIATVVGPIGFDANFGQGMAYDPNSDTIYMSAFNLTEYRAEWRSVNTTTGNTTILEVIGTMNPGGIPQLGWVSVTASAIPLDNDECIYARVIDCGETIAGDTSDGNTDTNGNSDPALTSPDEWFSYTSTTVNEVVIVSTCGQAAFDTQITVWQDCTQVPVISNDNVSTCSGGTSELSFIADGFSTYYISVDGNQGASGSFSLSVSCIVPPVNDMIINAIDVDEEGVPYFHYNVGTPAATLENGTPTGCNLNGVKGIWYKFTAVESGTAITEIESPSGVSFVIFFKAPDENASENELEFFLQAGNQCSPATSANITTEAGQTYYIFVSNESGRSSVIVDGTLLSTFTYSPDQLIFYPNPAGESLFMESMLLLDEVAVYNILGQRIMNFAVNETSFEIDTSGLSKGWYVVMTRSGNRREYFRFAKR